MKRKNYTLVCFTPPGAQAVQKQIEHYPFIRKLPPYIQNIFRALFILGSKKHWKFLSPRYRKNAHTPSVQAESLRSFLRSLGPREHLSLFTRSAGGIVASLVADEFKSKQIICLGYPFKHPKHAIELERFQHLSTLKTPFLIIQGKNDPYGNIDILSDHFPISPSIHYKEVNASHNFDVPLIEQLRIMKYIHQFTTGADVE